MTQTVTARAAGPARLGESVGSLGAETLPARIHELLEDAIISGVLAPGERLHADRLAKRYGVSRIPVREALRSLHAAGWVEIRPRYGVYVRERSEAELSELFEARSVVEAAIASWAASRRSPADLTALRRSVSRSRRAAQRGDESTLTESSAEFYDRMRSAAGNQVLATLSADLQKRARFYFSMVAGDLGRDWVELHAAVAEAVAAGDAEEAARLSRQHILDTGSAVAAALVVERSS